MARLAKSFVITPPGGGFTDPPPAQVWHGGKLRAAQTAEIPAWALAPNVAPAPHRGMKPKDDPSVICAELKAARNRPGAILLVSRLPHLARRAALLWTEDVEKKVIELVRAGVVKLRPMRPGWGRAGHVTPGCVRQSGPR